MDARAAWKRWVAGGLLLAAAGLGALYAWAVSAPTAVDSIARRQAERAQAAARARPPLAPPLRGAATPSPETAAGSDAIKAAVALVRALDDRPPRVSRLRLLQLPSWGRGALKADTPEDVAFAPAYAEYSYQIFAKPAERRVALDAAIAAGLPKFERLFDACSGGWPEPVSNDAEGEAAYALHVAAQAAMARCVAAGDTELLEFRARKFVRVLREMREAGLHADENGAAELFAELGRCRAVPDRVLDAIAEELGPPRPWSEGFEERRTASLLKLRAGLRRATESIDATTNLGTIQATAPGRVLRQLMTPFAHRVSDEFVAAIIDRDVAAINAHRARFREWADWLALREGVADPMWRARSGALLEAGTFTPEEVVEEMLESIDRSGRYYPGDLSRIWVAIMRFERRRGTWPASLGDLVPEFLERLPEDETEYRLALFAETTLPIPDVSDAPLDDRSDLANERGAKGERLRPVRFGARPALLRVHRVFACDMIQYKLILAIERGEDAAALLAEYRAAREAKSVSHYIVSPQYWVEEPWFDAFAPQEASP